MTDDWRNQTLADLSKQADKGASVIDRLPIHVIDEGGLDGGTHYWVHLYGVGRRIFGGKSKEEGFGITTHPGGHNPWKYDHFPTINAAIWAIRSRSVVNSVRVLVPRKPRKRPKTSRKLPARRRTHGSALDGSQEKSDAPCDGRRPIHYRTCSNNSGNSLGLLMAKR